MTKRSKLLLAIGGIAALVLIGAIIFSIFFRLSKRRSIMPPTRCNQNLKRLGNAIALYAAQYNDNLPSFATPSGSWMCDQSADWALFGASLPAADFTYCPANKQQDPVTLWGGPTATYRVTGYIWTIDRTGMPPLTGLRANPTLEYHSKLHLPRADADTELALDWIISSTPTAAGASWTGITAPGRPGVYDTSHLAGQRPAGGNILFYDGHVEWRSFDPAKATPVPQTPAGPVFWFPGK